MRVLEPVGRPAPTHRSLAWVRPLGKELISPKQVCKSLCLRILRRMTFGPWTGQVLNPSHFISHRSSFYRGFHGVTQLVPSTPSSMWPVSPGLRGLPVPSLSMAATTSLRPRHWTGAGQPLPSSQGPLRGERGLGHFHFLRFLV